MDTTLFRQKDIFPQFIVNKLCSIPINYKEKYQQIRQSTQTTTPQHAAGVVLLLNYKQLSPGNSEYVFQLIKRSDKVSQGGDISCPGGMLHPVIDKILSIILTTGLLPSLHDEIVYSTCRQDKDSIKLIRLFLATALREAWEEIGLNPFKVSFLGALPSYSLTLTSRAIFPLVCLTPEPFEFKLSAEVEKILEIPVSTFFEASKYALLEIETPFCTPIPCTQFPCIKLTDAGRGEEILWGATFKIIMNFLNTISDNTLPVPSSSDTIKKVLSKTYISRNNR
jgi:8-oxo-dGTP pyrophosphatase MutT (NUDIX family)